MKPPLHTFRVVLTIIRTCEAKDITTAAMEAQIEALEAYEYCHSPSPIVQVTRVHEVRPGE